MSNPYEPPQTTEPPCPFCHCDNCKVGWFLVAMAILAFIVWAIALGLERIGEWRYLNAGEKVAYNDQINLNYSSRESVPHWTAAHGWVSYAVQTMDHRAFRRPK